MLQKHYHFTDTSRSIDFVSTNSFALCATIGCFLVCPKEISITWAACWCCQKRHINYSLRKFPFVNRTLAMLAVVSLTICPTQSCTRSVQPHHSCNSLTFVSQSVAFQCCELLWSQFSICINASNKNQCDCTKTQWILLRSKRLIETFACLMKWKC